MKLEKPKKVTGSECLEWVDRDIGLGGTDYNNLPIIEQDTYGLGTKLRASNVYDRVWGTYIFGVNIEKIPHDKTKRIVGLIRKHYDDGGIEISILGDERLDYNNTYVYRHRLIAGTNTDYESHLGIITQKSGYVSLPNMESFNVGNSSYGDVEKPDGYVTFDDLLDYTPTLWKTNGIDYDRPLAQNNYFYVTMDKDNTFKFGVGVTKDAIIPVEKCDNPLRFISGQLYDAITSFAFDLHNMCPYRFEDINQYMAFIVDVGRECSNYNMTAIPYNIILTENENYAKAYINNGTLPPDAHLYPLDWESLPSYDSNTPDDFPDGNKAGDTDRDITPNLPVVPSYTPAMLSNYNWYWLSVPQYADFIRWFWDDIGKYSDFDDLIAKVEGLYNNVSSAVLMVRFFPVEYEWITGISVTNAPTDNISVGMIEKQGAVATIDQSNPSPIREIGHIHIPTKYESFCDLAPYTQLSLYLPWHGFVDLDIDLLMGHDLYVKGVYDYLSGTLQYLLYCDNEMLINTFVVKLAMDIPITLQTKNDRDSSIFQNVSNTLSGIIGACTTLATGNPIGMLVGANALNSQPASAPMRVMGSVGESGAYYAPQQCYIILRRPTIQGSDGAEDSQNLTTWYRNVGKLCGYGWTLSKLSGFTVCHSPRIEFKNSTPLQTEIDEIYDLLEKGVIL